jgi:retron-type reverse transcriptase
MGNRINMLPIVGGDWDNVSDAGVFNRNVNNTSSNSNNNVGGSDSASYFLELSNEKVEHRDAISSVSEIDREVSCLSNLTVENPRKTKRIGFLFEKAFSIESLLLAYNDAKKGKMNKPATLEFSLSLHSEIEKLHNEIMSGVYRPKPLNKFTIFIPKERLIQAPHFRDLVVQHAIYRSVYNIFDSSFIDQSYACRKGGGTHKASDYAHQSMRKYDSQSYYVKMDIRKFFYRIDRRILIDLFHKKIKDKPMIRMMSLFVFIDTDDKGLPIGNLLSQLYALIYLNPLDHFVKRELKSKHYVRYVDDFVCIGVTLEQAKHIKHKCEEFCKNELNLEFSKWSIDKIRKGLNFVGYRTWKSVKYVRRHSVAKFKKAVISENTDSVISLLGHAKHSATIVFYSHYLQVTQTFSLLTKRSRQLCLNILSSTPSKQNSQYCVF